MKHFKSASLVLLLLCGWPFFLSPPNSYAQLIGGMTCMECHVDPVGGGFHGGFRPLGNLTKDEIDVVCMSCHDGSYTNPQSVTAPEAAVHQNKDYPCAQLSKCDEYGDFKANCLDCHYNHSPLLAGDGTSNTNLKLKGIKVIEANSTDGIARIRKPIIAGPTTEGHMYQDGWECNSGIPDDTNCIESDPPAAGDGVRKNTFYTNIDTDSTHWVSSSPPYTGACNTCHTRTEHHRRDDSGGDHTHKIPQKCTNCHNHNAGWVNKGG